jgi:hypothetical protein
MNVLDILHSELKQASQIQEVVVQYVAVLPSEPGISFVDHDCTENVFKRNFYWINWSDYLGAWISTNGETVQVCITETARDLDLGELTLGFTSVLIGTCLNLQGRIAIHANAVIVNEQAVAFIGYSGAGKSTLSAFCTSRGAGFVTDDVLVVDEQGNVLPGNPRIKLYPETGASLGLEHSQETSYKVFYHPETHLGGTYQRKPMPLGKMYLLAATEGEQIYVESISPAQAVFELLTHGYDVSHFINRNPRLLDAYVRLVDRLPVQRLVYPHDFNRLPEVYEFLLKENHKP